MREILQSARWRKIIIFLVVIVRQANYVEPYTTKNYPFDVILNDIGRPRMTKGQHYPKFKRYESASAICGRATFVDEPRSAKVRATFNTRW